MDTDEDRAERFKIRRFANLAAMKAEEYRYWKGRPAHERMKAAADLSAEAYAVKEGAPHGSRLRGPLVRLQR